MSTKYKHPNNPIRRNISVFKVSYAGWRYAHKNDPGVRQWGFICLLGSVCAIWWGQGLEIPIMLFSLWMVYVVELLNTALEITLDRITTQTDEAVKNAKDIGSTAVFFSALIAAIVWLACLIISS